jgi:DNA-binding response OmpR family regulator
MSHATQILLATAIRDHADAYERVLEDNGFHVHVARTGEDAMTAALGQRFDCIVIDLRLPDTPGWALCGEMNRQPNLRSTPIVALEARPTMADDLVEMIGDAIAEAWSAELTA